jgi:hypothetical protein
MIRHLALVLSVVALVGLSGCRPAGPDRATAPAPSPAIAVPVPRRPVPVRPAPPAPKSGGITRTVVSLDWTLDPVHAVPTPSPVKRVSLTATQSPPSPGGPQTSIAAATLNGSVEGASFAPPSGSATAQVDIAMNSPDIISPSGFVLDVYLEVSYDQGLTFQALAVAGWQSGPGSVLLGTTTPAGPGVAVSGPGGSPTLPANALFRARVNSPQSLYFGATVSYFDGDGNPL